MRLFVAIVPPEPVLAELAVTMAPFQARSPELRWTRPDAWHLTLAFLGEVSERLLPDLQARLGRAAKRHPSQRLAVAGAGAFPAVKRATVLWAGLHADRLALRRLAESVAAGARRAGAPPPDEGRSYRAHLTLARARQPTDLSALVGAMAELSGTPWTAADISLVRSEPVAGQAHRYEAVASWPLAGQPRECRRGQRSGPT